MADVLPSERSRTVLSLVTVALLLGLAGCAVGTTDESVESIRTAGLDGVWRCDSGRTLTLESQAPAAPTMYRIVEETFALLSEHDGVLRFRIERTFDHGSWTELVVSDPATGAITRYSHAGPAEIRFEPGRGSLAGLTCERHEDR